MAQDYFYRDGSLLASKASTDTTALHFHLDHLGTPRVMTNDGGSIVAYHAYYPFGAELTLSPRESTTELLKFTGHERDQLAGDPHTLDDMHARYYSASLGMFLSVDPGPYVLDQPQAWNRYSYVANNPLKWTDPTGRCGEPPDFVGPPAPCDWGIKETIDVHGDVPPSDNIVGSFFSAVDLMRWVGGDLPRVSAADRRSAAELSGTPPMEQIRNKYKDADCRDGRYWGDYQYSELTSTTNLN